ncbi:hypothetical protein CHU98_g5823 [Xylaria longipes]|nr:hypothetical protein CHU98_g5823 [Xylaria longipes]
MDVAGGNERGEMEVPSRSAVGLTSIGRLLWAEERPAVPQDRLVGASETLARHRQAPNRPIPTWPDAMQRISAVVIGPRPPSKLTVPRLV